MQYMVPPRNELFGGRVPPNNELFGGTVPPNNELFGGMVPPNSSILVFFPFDVFVLGSSIDPSRQPSTPRLVVLVDLSPGLLLKLFIKFGQN